MKRDQIVIRAVLVATLILVVTTALASNTENPTPAQLGWVSVLSALKDAALIAVLLAANRFVRSTADSRAREEDSPLGLHKDDERAHEPMRIALRVEMEAIADNAIMRHRGEAALPTPAVVNSDPRLTVRG